MTATRDASAGDDDPDLPIGGQVGPYVLLDRLGRGGMGEVFLARDPRLDRPVALKCLLASEDAGRDLRTAVVREARSAARITHPHVAAIYDVVEHGGRPFIVMEYVPGETLAALLRTGPVAPARAIVFARQIADALAAAHASGIVHRDLKPSNIQVTPRGGIKILDFGIAMALASFETTRTSAGSAATPLGQPGTPPYMSPEQRLGGAVDERSDLFSLAVILYEMVIGRRPFAAPLSSRLVPPLREAPRADDLDPRIPRPLADLIARGLAADPLARFQSAGEMADALRGLEREWTSAPAPRPLPPPVVGRLWRVAGGGAAALVGVWGLGWISSAAFNNTMGRTAAFGAEPLLAHLMWGARSLVAPVVYAAVALIGAWTVEFTGRVLRRTPGLTKVVEELTTRTGRAAAALAFDDAATLAQGLATVGAVSLGLAAWRFASLIGAWSTQVSSGPGDLLWRLGPVNADEKILYRALLTGLFVALAAGLVRVVRLRRALGRSESARGVAALAIVLALVLLMNEAPYRILWQNAAPRGTYRGARCYVIGTAADDLLLFCPELAPPRNRIVRAGDPAFLPGGFVESVFTPAGGTASPAVPAGVHRR